MKLYDPFKRLIDIVVGGLGLVLTAPVQLLVGWKVRREFGSPVLFRQDRPGRNGRVFQLVKFRTMLEPDSANGLLADEDRLTPFGRRLRSTSLDELPTLWNVVRGDMSLVGPRPLRVKYLSRYTPEQSRRHEVRPGVTGLAQVSGRNAISWEARFVHDVEYVDRRSLALDLKILCLTITKVLQRDGISAEGAATMTEFLGAEEESFRDS